MTSSIVTRFQMRNVTIVFDNKIAYASYLGLILSLLNINHFFTEIMNNISIPVYQEFQSGEVLNSYESITWELLEHHLPAHYRCCPQIPLELLCARSRSQYIGDNTLWRFWVSSKVDFAILDRQPGADRTSKLVIECQSHYHDNADQQSNDRKKANLLDLAGIPLLYVRSLDRDYRYYRFYTPDERYDLCYNLITQEPKAQLQQLLLELLDSKGNRPSSLANLSN